MKPTRIHTAENYVITYYHNPSPETSFEDTLKPDYWQHVAKQMQIGYRIEMLAQDGSWWAMLIVRGVGKNEVHVGKLQHVQLEKADDIKSEGTGYTIKYISPTKRFGVISDASGEYVKDELQTKGDAQIWLKNHLSVAA